MEMSRSSGINVNFTILAAFSRSNRLQACAVPNPSLRQPADETKPVIEKLAS